jgi:hypothetical protein
MATYLIRYVPSWMEADLDYQTANPEKYAKRYIVGDPITVVDDGVLYDPVGDVWLAPITSPHCVAVHVLDLSLAEAESYIERWMTGDIVFAKRRWNVEIGNLSQVLRDQLATEKRIVISYDLFASQLVDKAA